ncbi:hypothetical protein AWB65_00339 [Caballeronia humi]|uniref:Uncharacterized protein n=1 Tax=Caballeronia humi TaxID=326474 RepID=A0A158EXR1_9BURK|nr:hypothetical protein AWB65_00339 [Caballeronia humi]
MRLEQSAGGKCAANAQETVGADDYLTNGIMRPSKPSRSTK